MVSSVEAQGTRVTTGLRWWTVPLYINCIKLGLSPLWNFKLNQVPFPKYFVPRPVTQSWPLIGSPGPNPGLWLVLLGRSGLPGFHVPQIRSSLQTVTTGKVNILGFYPSSKSCLSRKKNNPRCRGRSRSYSKQEKQGRNEESLLIQFNFPFHNSAKIEWYTNIELLWAYDPLVFQAPFFPREAVSKGLEVWHFGLVFGAFEITVFIVSPIIGANLNKIGVKVSLVRVRLQPSGIMKWWNILSGCGFSELEWYSSDNFAYFKTFRGLWTLELELWVWFWLDMDVSVFSRMARFFSALLSSCVSLRLAETQCF